MHLKQLKIFPIHVILIPVFFVWHIMNEYSGLIPFWYGGRYILYYTGLSVLIFIISKLLLKKNSKAGCLSAAILIISLFWGPADDFLKTLHLPSFFVSYKFLLSFVLAFLVFLLIVLRKKKIPPDKTNTFLTLLFSLFLLIETGKTVYNLFNGQIEKNNLAYNNHSLPAKLPAIDDQQKPDIFFIVFDEYASTAALKQYLHFDNTGLDSLLLENHFFVAFKSKGNYNSTPLSLASTFSLDYFNQPIEGQKTLPKELMRAQYTLKKDLLPVLFANEKYAVKNYGLCDLSGFPAKTEALFYADFANRFYDETIVAHIEREIWWNTKIRWPFPGDREKQKGEERWINRNADNFESFLHELKIQTDTPKFVFAHVLLPHRPYFLDRKGKTRKTTDRDNMFPMSDSLYLEQLIYTNTIIDSIARAANQSFPRPRVVIIEGDHGLRDDDLIKYPYIRDKQFMNLNSYYFSDKDYSALYDSISPVNSFRVVLNKYFRTSLPLLKDSSILLY